MHVIIFLSLRHQISVLTSICLLGILERSPTGIVAMHLLDWKKIILIMKMLFVSLISST